jgi:hypothetical protein
MHVNEQICNGKLCNPNTSYYGCHQYILGTKTSCSISLLTFEDWKNRDDLNVCNETVFCEFPWFVVEDLK